MTLSPPIEIAPTLLSAPIELAGDWGHMLPPARSISSSSACGIVAATGAPYLRQPTRLRVDEGAGCSCSFLGRF
jgi:hypothetical protein